MKLVKNESTENLRVLFIGNIPFSETGNNGKTFLSFFKDFEEASVAQLFFNEMIPYPNKFKTFFRVTDKNILKHFFTLGRSKIDGKIPELKKIASKLDSNTAPDLIYVFPGPELFKKLVRNFLFGGLRLHKQKEFQTWIEEYKPTVIFLIGSGYEYSYEITRHIASKYNIPYFIYFTDDYLLYNSGKSFIDRLFHRFFFVFNFIFFNRIFFIF